MSLIICFLLLHKYILLYFDLIIYSFVKSYQKVNDNLN